MKRKCPLGHLDKTWCLGCRYAKEGLCDWPHSYLDAKEQKSDKGGVKWLG